MAKGKVPRRRYGEDFKRRIVAEANAADVSVSEIARRHGLNANLVFNWRKKFGANQRTTSKEVCLVPVEIRAAPEAAFVDNDTASDFLEIDLPCGSKLRCGSDINPALLSLALSELRPTTQGAAL